jgi:hypothetical protein
MRGMAAETAGEKPIMNTAARRSSLASGAGQRNELSRGERRGNSLPAAEDAARIRVNAGAATQARVYVVAESRLLREALSRMLTRQGDIDVVGLNAAGPFRAEEMLKESRYPTADISRKPGGRYLRDSANSADGAGSANPAGGNDGRRDGVFSIRACRDQRVFAERRFGGRRFGSDACGASGGGGVPRSAVRLAVPVF